MSRFFLTTNPINLDEVIEIVLKHASIQSKSTGSINAFLGVVRSPNLGKRVLRLEYEAYKPLAVKIFQQISSEIEEYWPGVTLALHHRLGILQVGEASIAIATSSEHRAESFAACRYTIERVKQIAPIWKHEFFEGGHVWVEGALADPKNKQLREETYQMSCK